MGGGQGSGHTYNKTGSWLAGFWWVHIKKSGKNLKVFKYLKSKIKNKTTSRPLSKAMEWVQARRCFSSFNYKAASHLDPLVSFTCRPGLHYLLTVADVDQQPWCHFWLVLWHQTCCVYLPNHWAQSEWHILQALWRVASCLLLSSLPWLEFQGPVSATSGPISWAAVSHHLALLHLSGFWILAKVKGFLDLGSPVNVTCCHTFPGSLGLILWPACLNCPSVSVMSRHCAGWLGSPCQSLSWPLNNCQPLYLSSRLTFFTPYSPSSPDYVTKVSACLLHWPPGQQESSPPYPQTSWSVTQWSIEQTISLLSSFYPFRNVWERTKFSSEDLVPTLEELRSMGRKQKYIKISIKTEVFKMGYECQRKQRIWKLHKRHDI